MELNKTLAVRAIRLESFRIFMQEEVKITDEELKKLMSCGACWENFTWTPRIIEKINLRLSGLEKDGKLEQPPDPTAEHRIFTKEQKDDALAFIANSDADTFQIILRTKAKE